MNSNKIRLTVSALMLSFSIVACTTMSQPPSDLLSQTQSELKLAKEVGAEKMAPLAYRNASEHLASAQTAMDNEEYEYARMMLEKALAEAQFAAAKSQAQRAESASKQVDESLDALKNAI